MTAWSAPCPAHADVYALHAAAALHRSRHTAPKNTAQTKVTFWGYKIVGKYGWQSVCIKSYGALRTFMQNNLHYKCYF